MDILDTLAVRFHFGWKFVCNEKQKYYVGGTEAMFYIDRDKISLPEIVGNLRYHCNVSEGALLHWLFPGMGLEDGLRVLFDDNACLYMSQCITDGGVADIYLEDGRVQKDCVDESDAERNVSDFEDELVDMQAVRAEELVVICKTRAEVEKEIRQLQVFYNSPSKKERKSWWLSMGTAGEMMQQKTQRTVIISQGTLVPLKKMMKLLIS